jgi:hypothetical protein
MRIAKSFTLDSEVCDYLDDTKGNRSASERANELLRLAIRAEQYERLDSEAAAFFAATPETARKETTAFQTAALKTFQRD